MPVYLNTRGLPKIAIGICARCSEKFPLVDLHPDPNAPGLLVCKADRDALDPYRLAPKAPDPLTLAYARPDVPLRPGPVQYEINQMQAAIEVNSAEYEWQNAISDGNATTPEGIEADPLAALAAGDSETFSVDGGAAIMGIEDGTDGGVAAAAPVTQANVARAWRPNTYYPIGAQVTPVNPVGEAAASLTIYVFTNIIPGLSGASAPAWTEFTGTVVTDNEATWINAGLYLS